MVVMSKREFRLGAAMTVGFLVILFLMFTPIFSGKNAFEMADDFFNSIAKGSTYYMGELVKSAEKYKGRTIEVNIKLGDPTSAANAAKLLKGAGALVEQTGSQVRAAGDLQRITASSIEDSDAMFHNRGDQVSKKYGIRDKEALYIWWMVFKEMEKDLKRQKKFDEAAWISTVSKKAVELAYNFYGIEAKSVSETVLPMAFSLVFYVIYTMWWGYAILFLYEGVGLQMKPGAKKEV